MSRCGNCASSDAEMQSENITMCDNCNAREQQMRKLRSFSRSDAEASAAAVAEQGPALPSSSSITSSAERTASSPAVAADDDDGSATTDAVESESTQLCHAQCKLKWTETGDMIRCCLCFHWHHEQCVDEVDSKTTWWVCRPCRSLSSSVTVLSTMLAQQQDVLNQIMQTNATLVTSLHDLMAKNVELTTQVTSLSNQVTSLSNQQTVAKTSVPSQHTTPSLLIGASTIRDIACTDPKGHYIISRGGAKRGDILKSLKEMKEYSYVDLLVHVGTNDCSTKFPVEKLCENLKDIATQAKRVARTGYVTLSSITPRTDNQSAAAKGSEVKEEMKRVAKESGCVFVDNQDNFLCRNGDINKKLLLLDGLHLSKAGLISNLKLNAMACCRIGRSPRPGGDPQHSKAWAPGDQHQPHRQPPVWLRPGPRSSGGRRMDAPPQRHSSHHDHGQNDVSVSRIGHRDHNYCTFCGESNHRCHVCRYGMPVRCFRCHRDGHKQNFCDDYRWKDGEGGHIINLNSFNDHTVQKCTKVYTTDAFIVDDFTIVAKTANETVPPYPKSPQAQPQAQPEIMRNDNTHG